MMRLIWTNTRTRIVLQAQATVNKRASRPPESLTGIIGAPPHRDENPDCVEGEAKHEHLAERNAINIKADNVERDQRAAGDDSIAPEYFPERLLAAPSSNFGSEKLGKEFGESRSTHMSAPK